MRLIVSTMASIACLSLGGCDEEPKQQILESKATVRAAEEDMASYVLAGEGTVCGRPELAELLINYLRDEEALQLKYPDIAPAKIRKVLDDANFRFAPATIEGVRSDIGVVHCRFGRLVIAVRATADGAQLKIGPGSGTTSAYIAAIRIAIDRELQKLRSSGGPNDRAAPGSDPEAPAGRPFHESPASEVSAQRDVAAECAAAERKAKAIMSALALAEGAKDPRKIEASRQAAIADIKAACAG